MQERIHEDVDNFNEVEAPKPVDEFTLLDSLSYTDSLNTLIYYYHMTSDVDTARISAQELADVREALYQQYANNIRGNLKSKPYKDYGVTFRYIYYKEDAQHPIFDFTYTPEDYK
ncbi:MAG: hypothetical protein HUK02_04030 [Bacteroidaceae bacterium]|nr:hypothetical protein [Bacteroidaceae bacterium]